MDATSKTYQLVRVAEYYYEQNLSQVEIAERLGVSRATVSRLLAEALEQGIVEIIIHRPVEKALGIAETLRSTFNLREVIVVRGGDTYQDVLENVGRATAELLMCVLSNNATLGISFGNTLYHTFLAMRKTELKGIEVIQLMGSLGSDNPAIDGPELAIRMAERLNGTYRIINAPATVKSKDLRDELLSQPQIQAVLERASMAHVIVTGIGSFADEMSSLIRAGYMTLEERSALLSQGAVGHLLARPIDIEGNEVGCEYADRVIAAPLSYLRNTDWSIGCSGSPLKATAVLGAIRGHYYNALVIDEGTAREVLRLSGH